MIDFDIFQKTIKEYKVKKNLFIILFVAVIFLSVTYLTLSVSDIKEEDIPDYDNLIKDNGSEYKDYVNNTGEDSKRLLKDSQMDKIKQYKNLIRDIDYKKRNNPFSEPF
ncbi:MAG: hypothetical protein U9P70_03245 [Patescibacteria group bacterium]|nr:hypothetical protein [Patescibacteria group bacterium]